MVFKFFKREKAAGRESEMDDIDVLEPLAEPAVFANAADFANAAGSKKDDDKLELPVFLRRETEYKTDEDYLMRLEQFKRELREKRKA